MKLGVCKEKTMSRRRKPPIGEGVNSRTLSFQDGNAYFTGGPVRFLASAKNIGKPLNQKVAYARRSRPTNSPPAIFFSF
jgi:hypothetical protein